MRRNMRWLSRSTEAVRQHNPLDAKQEVLLIMHEDIETPAPPGMASPEMRRLLQPGR
jgi:hypothetical protein